MITSNQQPGKKKQDGLVLLVLVIILALTIFTYYFSSISIVAIQTDNIEKTRKTLKQAKQALLAYAMNYPDIAVNPAQGPGNFPCPDDDLDGDSDTPGSVLPGCNSAGGGTIGRFPWATVQTEELRDDSGELLWYAVSSNFANFADKNINTETTGEINLLNSNGILRNDGTSIDGAVAVIIAPGKTLIRDDGLVQSRSTSAERNDPQNYLDIAFGEDNASYTNSSTDGFVMGTVWKNGNVIVNDLMLVITYEDIMQLVRARVGEKISKLINDYFADCNAYPEASAFDPAKDSFDSEGIAPPNELSKGHLPLGIATPDDWGDLAGCAGAVTPVDWLSAEGWDRTTYYAFAYQNAPPVNTDTCGNGVNPACMTIINSDVPNNDKQALIVFAGRELPAQDRVTLPVSEADYFEGENNNLDNIYDADKVEDYIRVITP